MRRGRRGAAIAALVFSCVTCRLEAESSEDAGATIRAEGRGFAPRHAASEAQARELARQAAIVEGRRALAELVTGVLIDAETTVVNSMSASSIVREVMKACVRHSRVVGGTEHWDPATRLYTLTVEAATGDLRGAAATASGTGTCPFEFSGLIIDAVGADLAPASSLSVFDRDGVEVFQVRKPIYRSSLPQEQSVKGSGTYSAVDARRESAVVGADPLVVDADFARGAERVHPVIRSGAVRSLNRGGCRLPVALDGNVIVITD